ncbi:MAG: RNA methyltransferase [Ruminococcaceae bacterium]|nr:RNA methyltransferase [Oscillospiraceae bacterium]
MDIISSVNNPKIKAYCALSSSNKERREKGLFVLEGLRLCQDVLRSEYFIEELFYTKENEENIKELISVSKNVYEIANHVAEKMADTKNTQGVFCVVQISKNGIDVKNGIDNKKKIDYSGKYVLLENVQDPANLGAISRTAEAFGITGLIVSGGCDIYSPKAMRASMGALLRLQVLSTDDVTKTLDDAKNNGMKTFASVISDDAINIKSCDFNGGIIVVVGNEANGITEEVIASCDYSITIRMSGKAESLNVGAAASIIIWEMVSRNEERKL